MSAPPVSVIMRAKNSDWVIGQALAGLYSQSFRDFELLVVDSGSTDRTLEIVRAYPHRLIEIEAGDYYPGKVLNLAIEQARGGLIVFLNSDAVPLGPHTLARLLAAFDDPEVVGAFARQLPRPEAESWVRRDYALSFPASGEAPPWMGLSLPLAAIRKDTWRRHPFYTDAWGSEDTEWGIWAKRQGLKIRYVPQATVMHSHNYTLRQIYGRRFIEGEADAFIYRDRDGIARMFTRYVASVGRDVAWHVRCGDWLGLAKSPVRRAVYQWAYYKGHKLGERRIAEGDDDAGIGQRTVLSRYEK
ncbi:MAG: glycosyltransferase [Zetaproteobacteria bacterium]|nr:MAG: glycosyltransferase [Zetaproteobacteria bacterium]